MRVARWMGLALLTALAAGCGASPGVAYKELLDEDPQVRADAAKRLGQAQVPEAVDSLIAVLDDPDERVRVAAVQALGSIGDPRALDTLASVADDPLTTVRLSLAQALQGFDDPRALKLLERLLYDSDETVRLTAARTLGRMPGDEPVRVLLDLALHDESDMVRQHVVRVMNRRNVREAIPRIEDALQGEADIVRANAAMVLGALGDPSSVPVLLRALDDPFFKVRSLAAHSLYRLAPDDARVREALRRRLEVEDHALVRVDLAWNLARMGDRSAVEEIRKQLFHGHPEDVRAEAAMALGEVGDETDIPRLERALEDKKGLVRKQAYLALQKLRKA